MIQRQLLQASSYFFSHFNLNPAAIDSGGRIFEKSPDLHLDKSSSRRKSCRQTLHWVRSPFSSSTRRLHFFKASLAQSSFSSDTSGRTHTPSSSWLLSQVEGSQRGVSSSSWRKNLNPLLRSPEHHHKHFCCRRRFRYKIQNSSYFHSSSYSSSNSCHSLFLSPRFTTSSKHAAENIK